MVDIVDLCRQSVDFIIHLRVVLSPNSLYHIDALNNVAIHEAIHAEIDAAIE